MRKQRQDVLVCAHCFMQCEHRYCRHSSSSKFHCFFLLLLAHQHKSVCKTVHGHWMWCCILCSKWTMLIIFGTCGPSTYKADSYWGPTEGFRTCSGDEDYGLHNSKNSSLLHRMNQHVPPFYSTSTVSLLSIKAYGEPEWNQGRISPWVTNKQEHWKQIVIN